jgi:putative nucleotidyltransferase with HDIG domain
MAPPPEIAAMNAILFVDDDPLLSRAFRHMFPRPDFNVECVSDADSALEAVRARPPDIILAAYEMASMTGAELLGRVRERSPETVRLLATGQTDFRAAVEAVNRGEVFRILRKPWDEQELRFSVRLALEMRKLARDREQLQRALADKSAAEQRAYDELVALNENLESIVHRRTRDMLDALSGALDMRDNETQLHSRRVSAYAHRLAVELGLDEDACRVVEQGALLHDIGKIGVPDRVLLKPGPLDEDEWTMMRRHPAIGAVLLAGSDFLAGAREIVAQHHERHDGRGYPMGLVGDATCIGARIFAVVDTFDALTSDRPYRAAQGHDVARREIERVSGSQLDPRVVAAFCRIAPETWDEIRDAVAAWAAREAA